MRIFRKKNDKTLLENIDLEKSYYENVKTLYQLKRKGYKNLSPRLFDTKCNICEAPEASYLIQNGDKTYRNKKESERNYTKTLCEKCFKIFNDDILMNRIMRTDKLKRIINGTE